MKKVLVLNLLMTNPFFKNTGPYKIDNLLKLVDLKNSQNLSEDKIKDIKDLSSSQNGDITFFHSKKSLTSYPPIKETSPGLSK